MDSLSSYRNYEYGLLAAAAELSLPKLRKYDQDVEISTLLIVLTESVSKITLKILQLIVKNVFNDNFPVFSLKNFTSPIPRFSAYFRFLDEQPLLFHRSPNSLDPLLIFSLNHNL